MNSQHYFEADNANQLYLDIIESISKNPQYVTKPRGMEIKENLGVVARLTDPTKCLITFKERKLNYAFAAIEKLEYLSGKSNPDRLIFYNKKFADYRNKYLYFDGSYPERLSYWYRHIHNLLKNDPDTRQAVATIYGPQDRHETKDVPCTTMFQFFIRDNKLNLIATMRSNDVLWGFPYDTNGFCFVLQGMAASLGLEMGYYELHAGSLHIYTEKEEQLTKLLLPENQTVDTERRYIPIPNQSFDKMHADLDLLFYFERIVREEKQFSNYNWSLLPDWLKIYYLEIEEYVRQKHERPDTPTT